MIPNKPSFCFAFPFFNSFTEFLAYQSQPNQNQLSNLLQRLPRIISILQIQMPIIRRRRLRNLPRLIQRIQHLLRQRTLLNILQIPLQLRLATNANNNTIIPAVLDVKLRVVDDPSERRLEKSEIVLCDDGLDDGESFEGGVFDVARGNVGCFVFSAEEAAGHRVVDDDVQAVAAAGGD
jgi:hypothetical protein